MFKTVKKTLSKCDGVSEAVEFRGNTYTADKAWFDGTHRTVSPRQTLENLQSMLDGAGITRIADITGLDRIGLPVALAIRPNAWSLSTTSGKGLEWDAAAASAVMEAIELHHAESPGVPVVSGTFDQLADSYSLIPVEHLPSRKVSLFHKALPLAWTFGWDLVHQEQVGLPLQMVSLKAEKHDLLFNRVAAFPRDTNGLASGNHFLEALCAALCEVIERDAWACHLYAAQSGTHEVPKVDLSSIRHPRVGAVLDKIMSVGIQVHMYDCSVDTDVPVYRVVLCDKAEFCIPMADGYGAHLDPSIAMLRALTEAAQSRTVAISGSRDDMFDIHHGNIGLSAIRRQIEQLEAQPPTQDHSDLESHAGGNFHAEVQILSSRLQKAGMNQIVVVELAALSNGMSVLKVIVPGLEPCLSHGNAPGIRAQEFARLRG